jgi:hypothetical protein
MRIARIGRGVVAIVMTLVACSRGSGDKASTRWAEVERAAQPSVPAGDAKLMEQALAQTGDGDVPAAALDLAIAWSKANGGLPWRETREPGPHKIRALHIAMALIARDTPDALAAATYLGYRLRAEGSGLLDLAMGCELADDVRTHRAGSRPTEMEMRLAPADADVRRALAAEGVTMVKMVETSSDKDDRIVLPLVHETYVRLALDLPPDRAGLLKRLDDEGTAAQSSDIGRVIVPPKLGERARECFAKIDAYHAWIGP